MTKELFVSSTPHETKVGLVEDDQLAEIYLERENEYTLAGSIYKGRVTRVLPGMQSAFVDIGLERDAFLYVSDFMELQEHDEDVTDVIPVSRGVQDLAPSAQQMDPQQPPQVSAEATTSSAGPSFVIESEPFEDEEQEQGAAAEQQPDAVEANNSNGQPQEREGRGWKGRRRRRGRRGSMPESRFAKPEPRAAAPERPERPERSERSERPERPVRTDSRSDYGPPPGYQPIMLPGESISKYQRYQQQPAAAPPRVEAGAATAARELPTPVIAEAFPEDEPIFAGPEEVAQHEPETPGHENR